VQDSSALRSELSLGHFGTSADLSGQFGPTKLVPKCPGSEVSIIRDVIIICYVVVNVKFLFGIENTLLLNRNTA